MRFIMASCLIGFVLATATTCEQKRELQCNPSELPIEVCSEAEALEFPPSFVCGNPPDGIECESCDADCVEQIVYAELGGCDGCIFEPVAVCPPTIDDAGRCCVVWDDVSSGGCDPAPGGFACSVRPRDKAL
jgi:hypothetical protein